MGKPRVEHIYSVIKFTRGMGCGSKHLCKMDVISKRNTSLSLGYEAARKDQVWNLEDGRVHAWKELNSV
jgi:hypothetical protein